MRILLVVDGSSYSDMATKMLEALWLSSRTEVTVLTVVPEHTFLGGITLGKYCMVGAGSVVTKDVEPYALVVGNPARVAGRVDELGERVE